jgi:hypothetical protein
MDHVLSPHAWEAEKAPFRDSAFLRSPRLPASVTSAIVDVRVLARREYDEALAAGGGAGRTGGGGGGGGALLPLGVTAAEAGRLLSGVSEAAVLRLTHTRGLLCGIGDRPRAAREFNRLARTLLRAPPWCARCSQREGCPKKLAQWLTAEQIGTHRGVGEWCLRTPLPPAFQPGHCVLNI